MCKYIGIDYVSRGPETIVCDLNAGQFPDGMVDVAFVSGCLEYVNDPAWFIGQVARHCNICIISYCTIENFSQLSERRKNAWVNDMSQVKLIQLFAENKMTLISNQSTLSCNSIFVFSHACKVS